jgi:two-component system chemotaxis response regulator CheB
MNEAETQEPSVIVIGASVGAIEALSLLLPVLPPDYPFAVVVVVHVPPDRDSLLSSLFESRCEMNVKEAEDKEMLAAGTIYFAPPDYHLLIEPDFRLSLSNEEPVRFSRPSIDVLFETAADALGDHVVGIILTGANRDGAKGLRAICDAGGRAFVQLPSEAEGAAMPEAAAEICPEATVLPVQGIATALKSLCPRR